MPEYAAWLILVGAEPIPANMTVESIFAAAHVRPSIPTPY
jgi:hypothetical protein